MRKLFIILSILIVFQHANVLAGKRTVGDISFNTISGKPDPDPEPYADFTTLVVPIKRAGNLIIVEAQVDSVEGNFVLDTGAPYLVLNETYFRDSPKNEDSEATGVTGLSTE